MFVVVERAKPANGRIIDSRVHCFRQSDREKEKKEKERGEHVTFCPDGE